MTVAVDLSVFRTVPLMEAAAVLGYKRTQAYALVKDGKFPVPVRRIGREWRVRVVDLEAFFNVSS